MKRAIFVRSKMTIMAELEWGVLLISCWLFLNFLPESQGIVPLCWQMQFILYLTSLRT